MPAGDSLDLPLAPTLAALGDDPREALNQIAAMGFRRVQLSATQPGLRPRELDRSARRGLAATLRRLELSVSGIDVWIPPPHFSGFATIDRAVAAVRAAIEFAGDFDRAPLSLTFPPPGDANVEEAVEELTRCADQWDVVLADHAITLAARAGTGVGIDPAAWLASNQDAVAAVSSAADRLASARLVDLLRTGMRGPIGEPDGRLDAIAYRVALSTIGYRRPVVADARQWTDPWRGLELTAQRWFGAGT